MMDCNAYWAALLGWTWKCNEGHGNVRVIEGNQLVNLHLFFHIERKKLPNLGSNSWSSLSGSYPLTIRLMVSGYEPEREDHEFDPRLGYAVVIFCIIVINSCCCYY